MQRWPAWFRTHEGGNRLSRVSSARRRRARDVGVYELPGVTRSRYARFRNRLGLRQQRHRSGAIKHPVSVYSRNYLARLAGFIRETRREIRSLSPPADVLAGFGIESPPNSVVWMQSVHRAWLEICAQQRNLRGRLKQKLNPAHTVILALEKRRVIGRSYSKVVALSPRMKADIMRFYSVPDQDIVVIPNGFSRSEFSLDIRSKCRDRVRAQFDFQDKDKVIIFVANELERKGFHPLLRAVVELKDPDVHLLAVGRLNPAVYASEIGRLGMSRRVHWTGATSTVAEFYAAADLFVLPTQYENVLTSVAA